MLVACWSGGAWLVNEVLKVKKGGKPKGFLSNLH